MKRYVYALLEDGDMKQEGDVKVYDDQELKCLTIEEIGKPCACNEIRFRPLDARIEVN